MIIQRGGSTRHYEEEDTQNSKLVIANRIRHLIKSDIWSNQGCVFYRMSSGVTTRGQRKRNRPTTFDLDRSTRISGKRSRWFKSGPNMEEVNQSSEPQIRDLSRTINAPNADVVLPSGSNRREILNEDVTPEIQQMVDQSVADTQRKLRAMVRESVSDEMKSVNEAINALRQEIKQLSSDRSSTSSNTVYEFTGVPAVTDTHQMRIEPLPNNQAHHNFNPTTIGRDQPGHNQMPNMRTPVVNTHDNTDWQLAKNRGIRVEKFGLDFNGEQKSLPVEDFIFRLEYLQKQYKVPWDEIISDFHLLLSGSARKWYWLQLQSGLITEWGSIKHSLLSRYKESRSNFELMRDLFERKQQVGESVDQFFEALTTLRLKLEQPISEYELIKIAKRNLKDSVARMVYPINVSSLEQLRVECIEAERNFQRRETRMTPNIQNRITRNVHEIIIDDEEYEDVPEMDQISEIAMVKCWNCGKPGHVFMECLSTERKLFCYRCGKPNTITPKCPKCQSENRKRNEVGAGDHRSREVPASTHPQ